MTAQALLAAGIGIAASIDDLRRRQIANWIPVAAFVSGVALQTIDSGWRGAGSSLLGTLAGAAVFLVFYVLGGMGGGDVKLMAGFGALLGAKRLLIAALWTAGCGGLLALAVIAVGALRVFWRRRNGVAEAAATGGRRESIPYAPAIAAGVWLSLVGAS
ncbi:MAG TPA: prepilin peptidase [Bryobacteraceae bacterium]|nr:prepilin peptidase [Bryobacteraceae bacterium]